MCRSATARIFSLLTVDWLNAGSVRLGLKGYQKSPKTKKRKRRDATKRRIYVQENPNISCCLQFNLWPYLGFEGTLQAAAARTVSSVMVFIAEKKAV
jgi:hypothetical protein